MDGARKRQGCGATPLTESRGITLAFSGEDFSDPKLGNPSAECWPTLQSNLISFAGLNGRFHGLLTDRNSATSTLFNDRYGMHRVYYHEAKDAFYFAAEAKAILAVRPELRTINQQGLGEFLSCGCALENRTLFDGIYVMPPASAWTFQDRNLTRKESYFQAHEWESQEALEPEAYYQELRNTFSQSLSRYFQAEEPIAMSLTGGLDTRMIMAWHKVSQGRLPCYSFGGTYRECQDVVVARKVADACGQPYQVLSAGEEFLSRFSHYAERAVYLSDGCTGVNRSVDLYLNEKAGRVAPIRMTGNYGGEVLRRVRAFKPEKPGQDLFRPELRSYIDAATATYNRITEVHPLSFAVFRQAPWHHFGLLALEETQLTLRTPYLDNDFVRTVFRAPQATLANNDISLRLIADGDRTLARIPTDRGYAWDANSMADRLFQKFIEFTVKAEYAYDYGMPQSLARVDHLL